MAIAYVDSRGAISGTSSTALSVARPSLVDGHHLISVFGLLSSTVVITDPDSLVAAVLGDQDDGTNLSGRVYSKTADAEPASAYAWSLSGAVKSVGWVGGYFGVDPASPVYDWATAPITLAGTSHDTPAVDVPDGGWLLWGAITRHTPGAAGVASWTSDGGGVRRYGAASNAGSADITICVFDSAAALSADTGVTRTVTSTLTEDKAMLWALSLAVDAAPPASAGWVVGSVPI